jgi:hypothetical protein
MSSQWTILASTGHVALDPANRGSVTFNVVNSGPSPDQAVFQVAPEEPASPAWFAVVGSPTKPVAPAASVSFGVTVTVPSATPAGSYWLRGRVHSADTEPEETPSLSTRVRFDVQAPTQARRRRWVRRWRAVWPWPRRRSPE